MTLEQIGNPVMRAETRLIVSGVDPDADSKPWISTNVTHVWDLPGVA